MVTKEDIEDLFVKYLSSEQLPVKEWFKLSQLQEYYFDWWSESTVRRFVNEMSGHSEFREYVWRPNGKTTLVNYQGFLKFLRWKDKNKFKG